ncbi:MAG TPA: T9SS type A sorting domain-containing protein, partial [Aequorivita sp.]|nr:T9SS type A sorting domain-containing protein [Aequorivita sp.]
NMDGLGTFGTEKLITNQAVETFSVSTKDIDDDGDIDIVTTSYPNEIAWHENTDGQGNFGSVHTIFSTPSFIYRLHSEDLDADGDNDVIALNYDETKIIWFENEGEGNFGPEQILLTDFTLATSVYTDDYNNDGKIDILATSVDQNKIILLDNRGPLTIEENATNLFSIYPNPTNGILNINSTSIISEITIFNNLGQLLLTFENKNQIDISTLSEGIYFLKIMDENGQTETKKVLKK